MYTVKCSRLYTAHVVDQVEHKLKHFRKYNVLEHNLKYTVKCLRLYTTHVVDQVEHKLKHFRKYLSIISSTQ